MNLHNALTALLMAAFLVAAPVSFAAEPAGKIDEKQPEEFFKQTTGYSGS